jgi:transposase
MREAPANLPDDVAALQAMIALAHAEIATRDKKLSIFETEIRARDYRIEKLKHQLAGLRRHRFGQSSEALDQLELTLEEEEIARAAAPQTDDEDAASEPVGNRVAHPVPWTQACLMRRA